MLLSMTGQGQGQASNERFGVSIELRAINSRFLKINFNGADAYGALIGELENKIRGQVRRGTVNVHVRVDDLVESQNFRLNEKILAGYQQQLSAFLPDGQQVDVAALLSLPGVIDESAQVTLPTAQLSEVAVRALEQALEKLNEMREREGEAMAEQLNGNCQELSQIAARVHSRTPAVVDAYADRLQERINQMLEKLDVEIDRKDIVREIGIFADRCDINEELVRLESHLEQFSQIINSDHCSGRKLDFLTQELLRETNTIGSKSNDAEIASQVVQMKTIIERIREMVQNIE